MLTSQNSNYDNLTAIDRAELLAEVNRRLENLPYKSYPLTKLLADLIPQIKYYVNVQCYNIQECVYRFVNDISTTPLCKICDTVVKWDKKRNYYSTYCSITCANDNTSSRTKLAHIKLKEIGSEIYKKTSATVKEKYGVENIGSITREKAQNTYKNRTGYSHPLQNPVLCASVTEKTKHTKATKEYREKNKLLSDSQKLETNDRYILIGTMDGYSGHSISPDVISFTHNICGTQFTLNFDNYKRRQWHNHMIRCPTCFPFNKSSHHIKITNYLDEMNIEYVENTRSLISPYEIDIFIPSVRLGIEINGCFWHSELMGKDASYHLTKTNMCKAVDIKLLQFFDDEVDYKFEAVKSIISSNLKLNQKIYARKTKIIKLERSVAKPLLSKWHLQGEINASTWLGLSFNNEIIAILGISKSRFSKKHSHEIVRFCCKPGLTVVGALSKLTKYAIKSGIPSIISYCDKRMGDGSGYIASGFKYIGDSAPSFFCVNKSSKKRESRIKYQKHNLIKKKIDPDKLKELGYYKVWDCGTKKYELRAIDILPM